MTIPSSHAADPPDRLLDRAAWFSLTREDPLEPDLRICDAHHHLWDHGPGKRYLLEEIAADAAGGHNIVSTIFCECRRAYRQDGPEELKPVGETEFMHALAERSAQSGARARIAHGIIGYADFNLGARVAATLEGHLAASPAHFRGIRHMTRWHEAAQEMDIPPRSPRNLMADATWREGFAQLAPLGLSFDAWVYHPQLGDVIDLARAFPGTQIVLNHVGGPIGLGRYKSKRDEVFADWSGRIRELAACPNVHVKLGGLGMKMFGFDVHEGEIAPGSEQLAGLWRPYVETCIDAFGTKRAMFESNFPVDKGSYGYGVYWNTCKRLASGASASEKADLFFGTASRFYRLGL